MKAMILAAGLGTRLGEITRYKPKCLVEVHGKTLLEHAVNRLKEVGVDFLVINTHHFAPLIEKFIHDRASFGITVHLSYETDLLETGGALYKVRDHFSEESEFFVVNADVYHHLDLVAFLADQRQKCPVASVLVMSRQTRRYLIFDCDQNLVGRVDAQGEPVLVRDSAVQNLYAFSGIQLVTPHLFEYCRDLPEKFSIIEAYLKATSLGGAIKAYLVKAEKWSDVGTPERLSDLENSDPF